MDKGDSLFSDPAYDFSKAAQQPRNRNRNSMVVKTSSLDLSKDGDSRRGSFKQRPKLGSSSLIIDPTPILAVEELTEAEENRIANEKYGNSELFDPSMVANKQQSDACELC